MQKNVQILTMAKNKWIVGLEWEHFVGDDLKSAIRTSAEKNACNFGLSIEYNQKTAIGLAPSNFKGVSAAEALAYANQNELNKKDLSNYNPDWIVIEELGDDKFWMGVVKNGLPAPGYDVILNITEIKENVVELLYDDTYKIFSTSSEVHALINQIKVIELKNLTELTEATRYKANFKKYGGIPTVAIYAAAATIFLIGATYFIFEHLEGQELIQEALRAQEREAEMQRQKQIAYEQKIKDFEVKKLALEQEAKNKITYGLSGNPSEMLNAWYHAVGNIEVGTHGWDLTKVSCYYQATVQPKKFACDYLFKRQGLSTNRMFLEDYPDAKIDGENAVVTRNININPESLKNPDISIIEKLKGANNWNAAMISQLQLLKLVNIDYKFNSSNEITFEIPALPLSPQEEAQGAPLRVPTEQSLGVAQGTLNVSGRDFDFVKEFADNVNFYGTGLRKVDFNVGKEGKISWDATFDYFISTREGSLKSTDSSTIQIDNNSREGQARVIPSGQRPNMSR